MRLVSTLKKSSKTYLCPKNIATIFFYALDERDNFQIADHSWPHLFDIRGDGMDRIYCTCIYIFTQDNLWSNNILLKKSLVLVFASSQKE